MNSLALERMTGFPSALREAGLAIDPGRAVNFLTAAARTEFLSPDDLKRVGKVTLTSSPDDFPVFDAVFKSWFAMDAVVVIEAADDDENVQRPSPKSTRSGAPEFVPGDATGKDASPDALLARKTFSGSGGDDQFTLDAIRRLTLPVVATRHWQAASRGPRIDIARTMASARRTFGETLRLSQLARPSRPRNILLLIDVSGSMKVHSEIYLRTAHALTQSGAGVETFCFSTGLTRVTAALRHRNVEEALRRTSGVVFDFDGGTRIGDSLLEFLGVSRYAALVRGATAIVLSDGLECGSPDAIREATARLARLSHRLVWFTPLAHDPRYVPVTRAMSAILPHLDDLADGGGLPALHHELSRLIQIERQPRRTAARAWQGNRRPA